jgi:hypothetical protein
MAPARSVHNTPVPLDRMRIWRGGRRAGATAYQARLRVLRDRPILSSLSIRSPTLVGNESMPEPNYCLTVAA